MSIALSCNVYQDAIALRGLLETGQRYFDNIFILHTGPGGARSTDGTIELCESFGISPIFDDINKGFGVIRSRLIHDCGCDWTMILDADERFHPQMYVMTCDGDESYPSRPNPELRVTVRSDVIDQGAHVKNLIRNPETMALRSTRRHWFDYSMKRPSQNWMKIQDHQMRIVRNHPQIGYVRDRVMHEWLRDERTGQDPKYVAQDSMGGPFIDHFHLFFRKAQPGKKEWNESQYARLERGEKMIAQ